MKKWYRVKYWDEHDYARVLLSQDDWFKIFLSGEYALRPIQYLAMDEDPTKRVDFPEPTA